MDSDDPDELGEGTCDFPCAGDDSEICGGSFAISVYQYPDVIVVPPRTFLGCYADSKRGRIMTYKDTDNDMTTDVSTNALFWGGTESHLLHRLDQSVLFACSFFRRPAPNSSSLN